MKRIWGHVLSLCATTVGIAAVMPSCAVNDQSIFVRSVLAPSTNRQNGSCIYTDDPQQPQLLGGTYDVGLSDNYSAVVLVGNQLTPRGDSLNNRAESNRAHLQGGVVQVKEPGGALIREFTAYAVGFADPGANNAPDFGLMSLTLIDAPTKDLLAAQLPNRQVSKTIVVTFRVFGKTLGGVELESGDFDYPIRVCNGCLVSFIDSNDPTAPADQQPNCLKPRPTTGAGSTGPCASGQDEYTPCQSCQGRRVCDPKVP
jgi:hypothetical protein